MPATGQPLLGPRQPAAAQHPPPAEAKQDFLSAEGEAAGSMSRGTYESCLVFEFGGGWRRECKHLNGGNPTLSPALHATASPAVIHPLVVSVWHTHTLVTSHADAPSFCLSS